MGEPMAEFSDTGRGGYALSLSGDAVNVAVSSSRIGIRSSVIGSVGDDFFGRYVRAGLAKEGVDVDGLLPERGGFTGIYFITLLGKGDHEFTYYRKGSSASRYTLDDRGRDAVKRADYLHLSGITQAIGAESGRSALEAAKTAHSSGVKVSFDVNYRPRLWGASEAWSALSEIEPYVDLLLISTEDYRLLKNTKAGAEQIISGLVRMGFEKVVVKEGASGSSGFDGTRTTRQKSFHVKAVDATGAGDAYDAGMLCGLLQGMDFADSMRLASMNAALKCTKKGGIRGLPTGVALRRALSAAKK